MPSIVFSRLPPQVKARFSKEQFGCQNSDDKPLS
jgi:hypothetical protein